MRQQLIIIGILAALTTVAIGVEAYVQRTPFDRHLADLEEAIFAGEWARAEQGAARLAEEWAKRRPWLQITRSTQSIFEIDRALGRLQIALRAKAALEAADLISDIRTVWRDLIG